MPAVIITLYVLVGLIVPLLFIKVSDADEFWDNRARTKLSPEGWMMIVFGGFFWPILACIGLMCLIGFVWVKRGLPWVRRHVPALNPERLYKWLATPKFRREVK